MNHSRQPEIIAVLVVMSIASTLAVILRFVARNMSSAKYGLDDLFIVIALVRYSVMIPYEYKGNVLSILNGVWVLRSSPMVSMSMR